MPPGRLLRDMHSLFSSFQYVKHNLFDANMRRLGRRKVSQADARVDQIRGQ